MTLGHTVWEPGAPFDSIPYNLFACGMRTLGIEPGVTLDELRELFALFLVDPGRDLPPEDDLAAAFWEKALPHVKCEVVDAFAEGDAAEREAFYGEADQIENLAERAAIGGCVASTTTYCCEFSPKHALPDRGVCHERCQQGWRSKGHSRLKMPAAIDAEERPRQ